MPVGWPVWQEAFLARQSAPRLPTGMPVHITGTTTIPVIQADLDQLLQKSAGNLLKQQILGNGNGKTNLGDVLKGLFHH